MRDLRDIHSNIKIFSIRVYLIVMMFLFVASPLYAVDFTVHVLEQAGGTPVADATVVILETKTKLSADEKGAASGSVPAKGYYTFRAITPDGRIVQPRLEVKGGKEPLIVYMKVETPESEKRTTIISTSSDTDKGIVVVGKREKTRLSRTNIQLDEVKRVPGTFGEALRGVELVPGVSAPEFGMGEVNIRGAEGNANQYFLDDLPMGYVFHFIPINSVLHNDLIKSMDVYTGAFPANYGNATGGIVAIESIDKVDRFGGQVSYSLWSVNSLIKNTLTDVISDGYWIGAGRASYLDQTLGSFVPEGIKVPIYRDGQFKLRYNPTSTQSIYVYVFGARDEFAASAKDDPTSDPSAEPDPSLVGGRIGLKQAFHTEAVRHIWQPGTNFQNKFTVYYTDNLFYIDGSIGQYDAKHTRHNGSTAFRNEILWDFIPEHGRIEVGAELRSFHHKAIGTTLQLIDSNTVFDPFDRTSPSYKKVPLNDRDIVPYNSAWGILTLKWFGFEFKPGVRYDALGLTGEKVLDPRGTLSYTVPHYKTLLIGGAGVYHRVSDPYQFSKSTGNPNLRMERAEHYGFGIEQPFLKNWTFKVEAYHHIFTQMVVSDIYITGNVKPNMDPDPQKRIDKPLLYNYPLFFSNDGTRDSKGYEVYIKKDKGPHLLGWYGWISYSWSRTVGSDHQHIINEEEKKIAYSADERRIINQYDNSKTQYADFDRTVIINVVFGYRINKDWQIGARWKHTTGEPYTKIIGDDHGVTLNRNRPIFNPEFSKEKNTERYAAYERLDVRIDKYLNYSWGYGNLFFEALNVMVRKNQIGMDWNSALPYSGANPSSRFDFGTLEFPLGKGKRLIAPLFNLGIEVQF